MWFKNVTIMKLDPNKMALEDGALDARAFEPPMSRQPGSQGWFPPTGKADDALVHEVMGCQLVALMIEEKVVPPSALADRVQERCEEIEARTGVAPKRKEMRQIKEDVLVEMLPEAFSRKRLVHGYLDRMRQMLVLNTTSAKDVKGFCTQMNITDERIKMIPMPVDLALTMTMRKWILDDDLPDELALGQNATLDSKSEDKCKITVHNGDLTSEDITNHLMSGFVPTKLELTWRDQVRFSLTENMTLGGIKFLDGAMDAAADTDGDGDDSEMQRFDADFSILTGVFADLLPLVVEVAGAKQAEAA